MNTNKSDGAIRSPFKIPPIVMKKVSLEELLDLLRSRVNKGYMPGADGRIGYNSKPEYVRFTLPGVAGVSWPNVNGRDHTGFYAFDSFQVIQEVPKAVYLYLDLHPVRVLIRLDTEDALVAVRSTDTETETAFVPWPRGTANEIAIDRIKLQNEIDCFV